MYFPECGAGAVEQEVNRGFVSTTDQPLSLNAPETMLPSILTSCYFVTLCFSNTQDCSNVFGQNFQ